MQCRSAQWQYTVWNGGTRKEFVTMTNWIYIVPGGLLFVTIVSQCKCGQACVWLRHADCTVYVESVVVQYILWHSGCVFSWVSMCFDKGLQQDSRRGLQWIRQDVRQSQPLLSLSLHACFISLFLYLLLGLFFFIIPCPNLELTINTSSWTTLLSKC